MHALTAAHCLTGESITSIALLVGDHDLRTGIDTPYAAIYPLSRVLTHAGFNVATSANDIALVFTASPITFNYGVGPACLPFPFTGNTFAGNQVEATGWGTTSFGGPRGQQLRKVTLDVITNAVCRRSFPTLPGTNVCTYTMGRDMCQVRITYWFLWQPLLLSSVGDQGHDITTYHHCNRAIALWLGICTTGASDGGMDSGPTDRK